MVADRLASRVRTLRDERGWSVEEAAEFFDTEPAHVRRIENATTNPSLGVLVSIARAFDIDIAELLRA